VRLSQVKQAQQLPIDRTNAPDIVRDNFMKYLQSQFIHKQDWVHPTTGEVYSYDQIYKVIRQYRELDYEYNSGFNYDLLYLHWASDATRYQIAARYSFSCNSLRRRWNATIDALLLMLLYPELGPITYQCSHPQQN